MTVERGLMFGQVADLYDRLRPGYPAALFDELLRSTGRLATLRPDAYGKSSVSMQRPR